MVGHAFSMDNIKNILVRTDSGRIVLRLRAHPAPDFGDRKLVWFGASSSKQDAADVGCAPRYGNCFARARWQEVMKVAVNECGCAPVLVPLPERDYRREVSRPLMMPNRDVAAQAESAVKIQLLGNAVPFPNSLTTQLQDERRWLPFAAMVSQAKAATGSVTNLHLRDFADPYTQNNHFRHNEICIECHSIIVPITELHFMLHLDRDCHKRRRCRTCIPLEKGCLTKDARENLKKQLDEFFEALRRLELLPPANAAPVHVPINNFTVYVLGQRHDLNDQVQVLALNNLCSIQLANGVPQKPPRHRNFDSVPHDEDEDSGSGEETETGNDNKDSSHGD